MHADTGCSAVFVYEVVHRANNWLGQTTENRRSSGQKQNVAQPPPMLLCSPLQICVCWMSCNTCLVYNTYKRGTPENCDHKENNITPKWNVTTAASLEVLSFLLPGYVLLLACPQHALGKCHMGVTCRPRSDRPDDTVSLLQVRHLCFRYQQKSVCPFVLVNYQ